MNKNLSNVEKEIYQRTDEVLHYIWDPIGICDTPQARDEYHSYLPGVYARVIGDYHYQQIADYLIGVERDSIELPPDREKAINVAKLLIETKEWIIESNS